MPHTVTVEAYRGTGARGDVYDAPKAVRARVDHTRKLVRDKNMLEVVAEATVILPAGTVCPLGSYITLPGGTRRPVLTSTSKASARAEHHVEVTTA